MRKLVFVLVAAAIVFAAARFRGSSSSDMAYTFPENITFLAGHSAGGSFWAFAATRPQYVEGQPVSLDSTYHVYQFDRSARLLSTSTLGKGTLRTTEVLPDRALALMVHGLDAKAPESSLYVTRDGGVSWTASAKVPGAAVGAAFLARDRIAMWTERQVFVSTDWGNSWREINTGATRLNLSATRVPADSEGDLGVPLVSVEYDNQNRKTTSRIGVLSEAGKFDEKMKLDGRVMDLKLDRTGKWWVLVFFEEDEPETRVFTADSVNASVAPVRVRQITNTIPQSLTIRNDDVLITLSKWAPGAQMSVVGEVGINAVADAKVRWREIDFPGLQPSKVFFDDDGGAWIHVKSNNRLIYQQKGNASKQQRN